ncbi:hypothetical protein EDC04DRAFT_10964 [Pisolithus marmoratus]|nr:hypothetical protein EDC04DRAFT_10964 [Pisolithus marmoratus]
MHALSYLSIHALYLAMRRVVISWCSSPRHVLAKGPSITRHVKNEIICSSLISTILLIRNVPPERGLCVTLPTPWEVLISPARSILGPQAFD